MLFDVNDSSVDSYSSLMNLALPMMYPSYESVDVYNDTTSIPATVLESDDRHASADLGVVYNDITAISAVIESHDRQASEDLGVLYNDITAISSVIESHDRQASEDLGVLYNDLNAISVVIEHHDRQASEDLGVDCNDITAISSVIECHDRQASEDLGVDYNDITAISVVIESHDRQASEDLGVVYNDLNAISAVTESHDGQAVEDLGVDYNDMTAISSVIESHDRQVSEDLSVVYNDITAIPAVLESHDPPTRKKKNLKTSKEKCDRDRSSHPILPVNCGKNCTSECNSFTEEQRIKLWEEYWGMDYNRRCAWLSLNVKTESIKRRTVPILQENNHYKRKDTHSYYFPADGDASNKKKVCQRFFLSTLGYTSNSVLNQLFNRIRLSPIAAPPLDRRGKHTPKNKLDGSVVMDHINLYKPQISHYRRSHAPNTRYLPCELTVQEMYNEFCKSYVDYCSVEYYRKMIKEMKISFSMPKGDKCPDCTILRGPTADLGEQSQQFQVSRFSVIFFNNVES